MTWSPAGGTPPRLLRPIRSGLEWDALDDVSGDAPASAVVELGGGRVGVPDQVLDLFDGNSRGCSVSSVTQSRKC